MKTAAGFAALCLILLFLLFGMSGCTSVIEEGKHIETLPEIKAGTTCPLSDEQVAETFTGILCFLSDDENQLVRVSRELTIQGGQSRAEAVLDALLRGPETGERGTWPNVRGTTRAELECSGQIATVLLPARYRGLEPERLFALRYAIAESLLALPEVEYVNVLIGGREEGVDLAGSIPAGTFTHHSGNRIDTLYAGFEEIRTGGKTFTSLATIYYPSEDGGALLPHIRSVQFGNISSIEYMNTLLEELGNGADPGHEWPEVPDPLTYLDKMPEIIRDNNGKDRVMTLFFSSDVTEALKTAGIRREIWLGMIAETLLTFVPGVDGLEVSIGGKLLTELSAFETSGGKAIRFDNGLIERTDFSHLLGATVVGYRADESDDKLTAFEMCIPASQAENEHAILAALLDADVTRGIMPSGAKGTDVLAIRKEREQIVVNLSGKFGEGLMALSKEVRRLCIYSMVNTLTEGQKDRVIFFFGGTQLTSADGPELRGSFLRAPGMIRDAQ
ncbi:MAG: GerMN domain-containing protein [Clostridia bacterium]|nr:GerMN domain-containing protein [Clostridia bacterium]